MKHPPSKVSNYLDILILSKAAADVVSQSFGIHHDNYLTYRNYQNKRKYKYRFSLSGILKTLEDTLETDKEPIHHYKEEYGIVPPWILFKSIYFSTIINFIDQFKAPQQEMLLDKLYNFKEDFPKDKRVQLMMDTLYICLEYRNIAAHGGRIYNYKCKRELHFTDEARFFSIGFSLILRLLNLMKYRGPYNHLYNTLNHMLTQHRNAFPQDITYLEQTLNISISSHCFVWVTNKSNKYHIDKYCSGMRHAIQLDLKEAEKQGFRGCKKCCK